MALAALVALAGVGVLGSQAELKAPRAGGWLTLKGGNKKG